MSSVSSLNHLTVNGGVPLNALLKRTVALGRVTCDSGGITKLGGSENSQINQVMIYSPFFFLKHSTNEPKEAHCLTFDCKESTAVTASSWIGQFARVSSCVWFLELFYFYGHRVVLLNEFVFDPTGDFAPIFLPLHSNGEGTRYFATDLDKGA